MNGLDMMRAMLAGGFPPPPIAELIGLELTEIECGLAVMTLRAERRHANPMGTLHGGVLCDLGDAAMGCAVASTLAEGQSFTTIELKVNFFKPVWEGLLTSRATVLRRTRRLAYAEAEITDAEKHLVAKLSSSCMLLSGAEAQGR